MNFMDLFIQIWCRKILNTFIATQLRKDRKRVLEEDSDTSNEFVNAKSTVSISSMQVCQPPCTRQGSEMISDV